MDARDPIREDDWALPQRREFAPQPPVVIGSAEEIGDEEPVTEPANTAMIGADETVDDHAPASGEQQPAPQAVVEGVGSTATSDEVEVADIRPDPGPPIIDPKEITFATDRIVGGPIQIGGSGSGKSDTLKHITEEFLREGPVVDGSTIYEQLDELRTAPPPQLVIFDFKDDRPVPPPIELDEEALRILTTPRSLGIEIGPLSLLGPESPPELPTFTSPYDPPLDMPFDASDRLEHVDLTAEGPAQQQINFQFVECQHTPENAPRIAQALEGCKTVVLETAGLTQEQRAGIETALNAMNDRSLSPGVRAMAEVHVLMNTNPGYLLPTVKNLPESVERIRLFDISADHPDIAALKALEPRLKAIDAAVFADTPNDTLREMVTASITADADISIAREATMARQLRLIAEAEAAQGPHTIGVVTGLEHQGTRRSMTEQGFACTATTVDELNPLKRIPQLFLELTVDRILDPTVDPEPVAVDRAILEFTARYHGRSAPEAFALATLLPDQAVSAVMDELDSIKQSGKSADEIRADMDIAVSKLRDQVDQGALAKHLLEAIRPLIQRGNSWDDIQTIKPRPETTINRMPLIFGPIQYDDPIM